MLGLVSSEEGRVPRASSLSQPREDTREDGRGSPEPDPAAALISEPSAPGAVRQERLLFRPPRLWYFVVAARAD